jgi:nicotinamide mononucleotide transporter PnuC
MKNKQNKLSESLLSAARYFSATELVIWISSLLFITLSFFIFDGEGYLAFFASLLGVTSLIFLAKGNPIGQVLIIIFSLIYAYISYTFAYYGEVLTYLGMSAPMSFLSLKSWLSNPYKGKRSEVEVKEMTPREGLVMFVLSIPVTVLFYFVLKFLGNANLLVGTVSVTTSFIAVYLMHRRSPYYALAYTANDLVLIVLWLLATAEDSSYISVLVCFITFLVNDLYGFINWKRMQKKQSFGE